MSERRFVVLEGIDGAGKSTLATRIRAENPRWWRYHHDDAPRSADALLKLIVEWWRTDRTYNHVWDRGYLGNDYCGPTRRGTMLSPAYRAIFRALLLDLRADVVILDADPNQMDWPSDESLEQAQVEREYLLNNRPESYVFASAESAWGWWVTTAQQRPEVPRVDEYGVGARQPMFWLVGEQANPNAPCDLPFLTPSGVNMVWDTLARVNLHLVRVTNCLRPTDDLTFARQRQPSRYVVDRLRGCWEGLGRPQVISLGEIAVKHLKAAGIPIYWPLPHPQYTWRFHHEQVKPWKQTLEKICLP